MAGFLVYRPVTNDKMRVPYGIGGVFVNGADGAAALTNAESLIGRLCGPHNATFVKDWTAVQVSGVDHGAPLLNTTFQGEVVLPGQMIRGGGTTV